MEFIILGSGSCIPTLKRNASGYLLKSKNKNIVFDFGSGTLKSLLRLGITYESIGHIFLSHYHPDHISDLFPFFHACRQTRTTDLYLYGFKGMQEFVQHIFQTFPGTEPKKYKINFKEMEQNTTITLQDFSISSKLLKHCDNCLGFRIQTKNKTIVYSGDTDVCDNLLDLSKNADILLLECSFPNSLKKQGHLTPSEAGDIAMKAKARQLVLTHFYPICDTYNIKAEAQKTFTGKIILAKDLMKIKL